MAKKYDSTEDTLKHKALVKSLMGNVVDILMVRAEKHDNSKLKSPEKELFDEFTPKLKDCTYGSDEYKEFLKGLSTALDHHYAVSPHHPEHYEHGVDDMDLIDLVELICDWTAASKRHADGNIYKSISLNKERFNITDQLAGILKNTVDRYFRSVVESDYNNQE